MIRYKKEDILESKSYVLHLFYFLWGSVNYYSILSYDEMEVVILFDTYGFHYLLHIFIWGPFSITRQNSVPVNSSPIIYVVKINNNIFEKIYILSINSLILMWRNFRMYLYSEKLRWWKFDHVKYSTVAGSTKKKEKKKVDIQI